MLSAEQKAQMSELVSAAASVWGGVGGSDRDFAGCLSHARARKHAHTGAGTHTCTRIEHPTQQCPSTLPVPKPFTVVWKLMYV